MMVKVYRNHDATEWTTVPGDNITDVRALDVFGNEMILTHEFETTNPDYDDILAGTELRVARKASDAYQAGYIDGLSDIANAPCAIHAGMRHGGEAEALRLGIETIIREADTEDDHIARAIKREVSTRLQMLLDETDASDSLAEYELQKTLQPFRDALRRDQALVQKQGSLVRVVGLQPVFTETATVRAEDPQQKTERQRTRLDDLKERLGMNK